MQKIQLTGMLLIMLFGCLKSGWTSEYHRVDGDYDGDGRLDMGIYMQPSGKWVIFKSSGGYLEIDHGWADTVPVPGDYDGDGIWDLAVFQQTNPNAVWSIAKLTGNTKEHHGDFLHGWADTVPVPGDYDGDGIWDLAVFQQTNPDAVWSIAKIAGNTKKLYGDFAFGWADTVPVPGDYDGDGIWDLAVFQQTNPDAVWHVDTFSNEKKYGWAESPAAQKDYDYDGKTDIAVEYQIEPGGGDSRYFTNTYIQATATESPGAGSPRQVNIDKDIDEAKKIFTEKYLTYLSSGSASQLNSNIFHIDQIAGTDDTDKFKKAVQLWRTGTLQTLVVGDRVYKLDHPVIFDGADDSSNLTIIGVYDNLIYSGESVAEDSGTADSSALIFKNTSHITIAGVNFQGRKLDRSCYDKVYMENGWSFQVPGESCNKLKGRALRAEDVNDFTVLYCKAKHYQGAGVFIYFTENILHENYKIIGSEFIDCNNYINWNDTYTLDLEDEKLGGQIYPYDKREVWSDLGAIMITTDFSFNNVLIQENTIVGPIMNGIGLYGKKISDITINNNYVSGYNFQFSLLLDNAKNYLYQSYSEMGVYLATSGASDINISRNYIAGFMSEGIVIGSFNIWKKQLSTGIYISGNYIIDSGYRGILLSPYNNYTAISDGYTYANVSVKNNYVIDMMHKVTTGSKYYRDIEISECTNLTFVKNYTIKFSDYEVSKKLAQNHVLN